MMAKLVEDDCRIRKRKYESFRAHTEAEKLAQAVFGHVSSPERGEGLKIFRKT